MSIIRSCPVCRCHRKKGSGGWAVEFNCGTRWGNMSESIVWRGIKCLEKEKGRKLTKKERMKVIDNITNIIAGII